MIIKITSTPTDLYDPFAFSVTTRNLSGIAVTIDINWEIQRRKNMWRNGVRCKVDTSNDSINYLLDKK